MSYQGGYSDRGGRGGFSGRGGRGSGFADRGGGRGGGYSDRGGGRGGGYSDRGGRGGFSDRGGGRGGGRGRGFQGSGGDTANYQNLPESVVHRSLLTKPSYGREGTPVELIANFYKFEAQAITVSHYDICVTKHKDLKDIAKIDLASDNSSFDRFVQKFSGPILGAFMAKHSDILPKNSLFVYDGFKNMYTSNVLNLKGKEFTAKKLVVDINGKPSELNFKIMLVDTIQMNGVADFYNKLVSCIPEKIISIYETFYDNIAKQNHELFQRKFYDISRPFWGRDKMVQYANGFINSVRQTEFGLAFNVHLKTTCVIADTYDLLTKFVQDLVRAGDLSRYQFQFRDLQQVNKMLRHLKIYTTHTSKKIHYTIDRVVKETPEQYFFVQDSNNTNKKMSILQFFKERYGINLLSLPLVKTTGKNPKFIPMELCHLVEKQIISKNRVNNDIERDLLTNSTHAPNVYFGKAQAIVDKVAATDKALYNKFGVDLTVKPVKFNGRVLPAPRLSPGSDSKARFQFAPTGIQWAFFCFDQNIKEPMLKKFSQDISNKASFYGLKLATPSALAIVGIVTKDDIKNVFQKIREKLRVDIVLVGIPTRHPLGPASMYSLIKHHSDQQIGVVTQCFKSDYVENSPGGYFDNLCLKINGKLGGRNTVIDPKSLGQLPFSTNKTMVVGIDVNHPGETEKVLSSISAAVGSLDDNFSKYTASIRVQKKERDEMVHDLNDMFGELFNEYMKANRYYPENVIVFRDGVSEGQFEKVINIEIKLMQEAIKKINKSVKLCVIVTQKNHHSRFVLSKQNTSGRRPTYNVASGTVVDQSIVEPTYRIFYLNSHFSPLGTSKPMKYIVLRDDLKLENDTMHKFCFYMCHNCIRTRTVLSLPTPVRYADLCAYRSKLHIEIQRQEFSENQDPNFEEVLIRQLNTMVKINEKVKNRLYYC